MAFVEVPYDEKATEERFGRLAGIGDVRSELAGLFDLVLRKLDGLPEHASAQEALALVEVLATSQASGSARRRIEDLLQRALTLASEHARAEGATYTELGAAQRIDPREARRLHVARVSHLG